MRYLTHSIIVFGLINLMACSSSVDKSNTEDGVHKTESKDNGGLITAVITEEMQKSMTIDQILKNLKEGNHHFIENDMVQRDHLAQLHQLDHEQHPEAVILSCIDSRVPVEQIFDQGIGDLFVVRVAGNIDNDHNVASLEYSCKVAGAKVIVVLCHENCGAVKSAIKGVDLGNITELLTHIQPAIDKHQDFEGEKSIENEEFFKLIIKENALMTIDDIRRTSPILKEMEEKGEIKMVGAFFNLHTGEVEFLNAG